MEKFLKEIIDSNKFELLVDTNIFSKDIVLKSAYNFLDKGYFFFKLDKQNNMIVQFTKKESCKEEPKTILLEFSDELLSVKLRNDLEVSNKDIREKIVGAAISNSLDVDNFSSVDTGNTVQDQIDFDKDIDDILKEIESDPDLQIDEEEISKILQEIEGDFEEEKAGFIIDIEAVKRVKKDFNK